MTPEQIEYRYLSLRAWIFRTVTPAMILLIIALLLCMGISNEKLKDQSAVLIGFSALYFIIVRGGHIIMVRSLHKDMLEKHEAAYREQLSRLSGTSMPRNISFALARIKREIYNQQK